MDLRGWEGTPACLAPSQEVSPSPLHQSYAYTQGYITSEV